MLQCKSFSLKEDPKATGGVSIGMNWWPTRIGQRMWSREGEKWELYWSLSHFNLVLLKVKTKKLIKREIPAPKEVKGTIFLDQDQQVSWRDGKVINLPKGTECYTSKIGEVITADPQRIRVT